MSASTRMAIPLADDRYRFGLRVTERGRVVAVGDGIVWLDGLPSVAMGEILRFEDGSRALVYQLERDLVGGILLEQTRGLSAGTGASRSGERLTIGAGEPLLGRVVDPLGAPLDGLAPPAASKRQPLDTGSPPIVTRDFVDQPLETGNKIVDTMVPIGKGQRQLIVGDNGVGKTSLALDVVINQLGKGVVCVYVLIGQKRSSVAGAIEILREAGALSHTVVVVAEATAMPGLKYLAPFAGCAVAEGFMQEGRDALVVYDDLTTHARAYRELSLLLRRPPGREAYPGDIFYLHSRLLERSTRLAAAHGGGSMTALPIVETEQGEIATYIPTNLISITDGQVYLDQRLFAGGFLPAIDITRSVSRIGGKAQYPAIACEAGRMKLDYLQFLELEVFTRFGAQLEASIEERIRRGRVLRQLLKQDRMACVSKEFQLAWTLAFNEKLFDALPLERVGPALGALAARLAASGPAFEAPRDQWCAAVRGWMEEIARA